MMGLAGLSYASLVVSSFSRAQNRVLQMGFADDINTYVMISGKKYVYMVTEIDWLGLICIKEYLDDWNIIWFHRNLALRIFTGKFCWAYYCRGSSWNRRISQHNVDIFFIVFGNAGIGYFRRTLQIYTGEKTKAISRNKMICNV